MYVHSVRRFRCGHAAGAGRLIVTSWAAATWLAAAACASEGTTIISPVPIVLTSTHQKPACKAEESGGAVATSCVRRAGQRTRGQATAAGKPACALQLPHAACLSASEDGCGSTAIGAHSSAQHSAVVLITYEDASNPPQDVCGRDDRLHARLLVAINNVHAVDALGHNLRSTQPSPGKGGVGHAWGHMCVCLTTSRSNSSRHACG